METRRKRNERLTEAACRPMISGGVKPPLMGTFFPEEFYDGRP